jgi:D-3-phosphoglycerate dehydrogenase
MFTVLLTAPYMLPFKERFIPVLNHYHIDVIVPEVLERLGEDEILKYAGQFNATICGDDSYSPRVLQKCAPRLKVISKWGTGIDSINKECAESLGIQVFNTPNAFTHPVADSVMGYILAFARRQPWLSDLVKSGKWEKLMGRSLNECSLGVVGVGNIGKAILRRALVFGMHLYGNDIIKIESEFVKEVGVEMVDLPSLVKQSDFISINCTLNPTSIHLFNKEILEQVKPGSVLINTARGSIIDEQSLVDALNSGRLAGAALDVFETEPLPHNSPLKDMENVLLAPHNSNSSPSAWERVHWSTILNALKGLGIPCDDFDSVCEQNSKAGG